MGKFLKLLSIAVAFAFVASAAVADTTQDDVASIPIDITIGATTSLTVEVLNIADDLAAALSFDTSGVSIANPYAVSDQYISIAYESNYALWGIGIVTDNVGEFGAGLAGVTLDDNGTPADTSDDSLSYGGLVNTGALDDPRMRASLLWQVYADKDPVGDPNADDDTTFGDWNGNWAYVADISNTGIGGSPFDDAILEDGDGDGDVDDPTYPMIVVGGGGGDGSLAQHPAVDPKPGDADGIVVYVAANFVGIDYATDPATEFLLPAGDYSTDLYVELIHE